MSEQSILTSRKLGFRHVVNTDWTRKTRTESVFYKSRTESMIDLYSIYITDSVTVRISLKINRVSLYSLASLSVY